MDALLLPLDDLIFSCCLPSHIRNDVKSDESISDDDDKVQCNAAVLFQ